MGMYTEFHFNSELKADTPDNVIKTLQVMLGEEIGVKLPEHPLFGDTRWRFMLICDSYYFDADTYSTLRYDDIARAYFLCIRSNFKNYSDEIKLFIDWITPYLDKEPGEFLGFYRYKKDNNPTLIYMPEKGIF